MCREKRFSDTHIPLENVEAIFSNEDLRYNTITPTKPFSRSKVANHYD